MCGIVGYVGYRNSSSVLIKGLETLEYRGYDSAGIACVAAEAKKSAPIISIKEKGKLSALKEKLKGYSFKAHIGIGHTRWATHGEPSRKNAHPHLDYKKNIALVHNGIVENYDEIKTKLKKNKVRFLSDTDTEVAANLIGYHYTKKPNLLAALKKSVKELKGFFAFVLFEKDDPETLYVFKRSNPVVIGIGKGENFVASDVTALLPYTREVIYLEDDEYAIVEAHSVEIYSLGSDAKVKRKPTRISWNINQAQKGGYKHFMLKEMHEQPQVLQDIIEERVDWRGNVAFDTLNSKDLARLKSIQRISFISCGTAYHAGIVASYGFEELTGMPCRVQVSSEFRYSNPIVNKKDLVVLITQSGETADTLAALREAKSKGALTLAVVNVVGSTMAREADFVIYTHAGPEIGVASTKAYTAQLLTLFLFSLLMAKIKGKKKTADIKKLLLDVKRLPKQIEKILKSGKVFEKCAKKHYLKRNFLFLGRGVNFPSALEGALKLKEISYAHAHGYAAGEMKHGPIALIDDEQVVLCIAPSSATHAKMVSNIEEIRARDGIVVSIGTEKDAKLKKMSDDFFAVPKTPEILSPILTAIPLQFFAYHVANLNGREVDQPRNLAKSVTVE